MSKTLRISNISQVRQKFLDCSASRRLDLFFYENSSKSKPVRSFEDVSIEVEENTLRIFSPKMKEKILLRISSVANSLRESKDGKTLTFRTSLQADWLGITSAFVKFVIKEE